MEKKTLHRIFFLIHIFAPLKYKAYICRCINKHAHKNVLKTIETFNFKIII